MSVKNIMISPSVSVVENLDINGNLNVDGSITIAGQPLNPSGNIGSLTLTEVLTAGDDGGNKPITNVSTITTNGRLQIDNSDGTDCQLILCPTPQSTGGLHYGLVSTGSVMFIGLWDSGTQTNLLTLNTDGSANIAPNGSLTIGNNKKVYDENYNFPFLSTILAKNNNANGSSITNVNAISCKSLTVNGVNITGASSNTSGIIKGISGLSVSSNSSPVGTSGYTLYTFSGLPSSNYFEFNINNFNFQCDSLDIAFTDAPLTFYLQEEENSLSYLKCSPFSTSVSSGEQYNFSFTLKYYAVNAITSFSLYAISSGYNTPAISNGSITGFINCSNVSNG